MTSRCKLLTLVASLVAALAAPGAHAGVVEVVFDQPDRYTDAGRGTDAEAVRQALARHLQKLGRDGLPAAQTLRITVTDIDLAGDARPRGRWGQDLRVMTGRTDWPAIALRYTLSEGARELTSGTERLVDMAYMDRLPAPPAPYVYEERLLTRWFTQRFGSGPAH